MFNRLENLPQKTWNKEDTGKREKFWAKNLTRRYQLYDFSSEMGMGWCGFSKATSILAIKRDTLLFKHFANFLWFVLQTSFLRVYIVYSPPFLSYYINPLFYPCLSFRDEYYLEFATCARAISLSQNEH